MLNQINIYILVAMLAIFTGFGNAYASDTISDEAVNHAKTYISCLGDKALAVISDESIDKSEKEAEFRKLLEENFAVKTIGRFALGTYWREANTEQQKKYLELFQEMIVKVYTKRFSEYEDQDFEVVEANSWNGRDIVVSSYVIDPDSPKIKVDWVVRHKNGAYKIVDVVVEGVSMSITQRSDFASIIQRGGGNVQVLIDHIESVVSSEEVSSKEVLSKND